MVQLQQAAHAAAMAAGQALGAALQLVEHLHAHLALHLQEREVAAHYMTDYTFAITFNVITDQRLSKPLFRHPTTLSGKKRFHPCMVCLRAWL